MSGASLIGKNFRCRVTFDPSSGLTEVARPIFWILQLWRLRLFLLKSWMPRHSPTDDWQDRYEWINNDALNPRLLEKHSAGAALQQSIELDLEVTRPDIDNIVRAKSEAMELQERAKSRYTSFPGSAAASWNTEGLEVGVVLPFRIVNGSLQQAGSPSANTFRSYFGNV